MHVYIDEKELVDNLSDDDLINELDYRGYKVFDPNNEYEVDNPLDTLIENIYNLKRNNKSYEKELNDLIYKAIGRIL